MTIFTVSQITNYISFQFSNDSKLKGIILKGEISNFSAPCSGHFYFNLKDGESSIKAVMFKKFAQSVRFTPEDGMNVIVMGSVEVFGRDGVYQVRVTDIQPDGVGAESVALKQLKEKLKSLGIFDESHKRPLPEMPKKIGIVTSPTGAALQDVINVLSRRYPIGELCVFPSQVQGDDAPDSICSGIIAAGKSGCDVLIVGRGGGSSEELSAFDTEKVAMCIYNSSIPVVSAVGHETDFTLSDLAADMRVPTPSAAAEIVSPSVDRLLSDVDFLLNRISNLNKQKISEKQNLMERVERRLAMFSPQFKLETNEKNLSSLCNRLESSYVKKVTACEKNFITAISKMEAMSPLKVMSRGYSLTYKDNKILSNVKNLEVGDNVDIRLAGGEFSATVTNIKDIGEK